MFRPLPRILGSLTRNHAHIRVAPWPDLRRAPLRGDVLHAEIRDDETTTVRPPLARRQRLLFSPVITAAICQKHDLEITGATADCL